MKLLVCGSRRARDGRPTRRALDKRRKQISCIIVGGARGVDTFAERWAAANGIPCLRIGALWRYYGDRAGPMRNAWMLKFGLPDRVLALPGGNGTESMVTLARAAGVPVTRVKAKR